MIFVALVIGVPFHPRGFAPDQFQVVVVSQILAEQVNDHVHEVHDDPIAGFAPRHFPDPLAALGAECFEFVRDGADLPAARSGGDHEVIRHRAAGVQVQHENLFAVSVPRQPGDGRRPIPRFIFCRFFSGHVYPSRRRSVPQRHRILHNFYK